MAAGGEAQGWRRACAGGPEPHEHTTSSVPARLGSWRRAARRRAGGAPARGGRSRMSTRRFPLPLVLVHGGGHGSWCWEPLLPYLMTDVLAVDLPPVEVRRVETR